MHTELLGAAGRRYGPGGPLPDALVVAVGSGGAITAMAVALQKFIERHKDKKFVLKNAQTTSLLISGYSAAELERLLIVLRKSQERPRTDEIAEQSDTDDHGGLIDLQEMLDEDAGDSSDGT